jgi:hypothetical protein
LYGGGRTFINELAVAVVNEDTGCVAVVVYNVATGCVAVVVYIVFMTEFAAGSAAPRPSATAAVTARCVESSK